MSAVEFSLVGSGWLRNFECEWADRMNSQPSRDPTVCLRQTLSNAVVSTRHSVTNASTSSFQCDCTANRAIGRLHARVWCALRTQRTYPSLVASCSRPARLQSGWSTSRSRVLWCQTGSSTRRSLECTSMVGTSTMARSRSTLILNAL